MSINIALIPLALVMYVVMGEEKFNDLVSQSELVKYTNCKNFKEMEKYIKSAGYDFGTQYGILKTHFKYRDYFTWEIRNGYVCAIFSVYDDVSEINAFIRAVEAVTGKTWFFDSVPTASVKSVAPKSEPVKELTVKPKPVTEQVFKTKFADKEMLIKTLKSIGLTCTESGNELKCSSDNYTLVFTKKDANYEFKVIGNVSNKEAYQKYKDIDSKYGETVQKEVVENVKRKVAQSQTMQLEQEEVLEDNSVLLTIRI